MALLKAIATFFHWNTASRTRASCSPSLSLTEVTISINVSGVIRKSAKLLSYGNIISVASHMLKPQLFSVKDPKPFTFQVNDR